MGDQTLMVELAKVAAATVKAQNAKFFTADLKTTFSGPDVIRVSLSCNSAANLQVTYDGGTTWLPLNSAQPLVINAAYEFAFTVDNADAFNLRCTDGGGTTLNRCLGVEVATG